MHHQVYDRVDEYPVIHDPAITPIGKSLAPLGEGFAGFHTPKTVLRMRPLWRGLEQLDLLGHQQWTELRGEALDKILVCIHRCPMGSRLASSSNSKMDKLVDRTGIGLKVADQVFVMTALLERRKSEFLGIASQLQPSRRHEACRFATH